MNYELIYYRSSATAEIQHITEKNLSDTGLKLSDAYAAAAPGELADRLSAAVRKVKLIFIVSEQSGENVLKKILSPKKEANSKTITTENGAKAVIYTSGEQTIILVPGEMDHAEDLLKIIRKKLTEKYHLQEVRDEAPDIGTVSDELDKQLSSVKRVRVTPSGSTAEKRIDSTLKGWRTLFIILMVLAFLQLGAAAYIYFLL